MAQREAAKMLEVVGEMPGQAVIAANAAALIRGGNQGDDHTATETLLRGSEGVFAEKGLSEEFAIGFPRLSGFSIG